MLCVNTSNVGAIILPDRCRVFFAGKQFASPMKPGPRKEQAK